MDRLRKYTKEITELTQKIEEEYPELYQYLDEIPPTIPSKGEEKLDVKALGDYLEQLHSMLQHYIEMHENEKK